MKETFMKQQSTTPPSDQPPSFPSNLASQASTILFRGDKWMRVEAGSEMERRGRAKGWTEFGPGRELEHMNKAQLTEVAENLRSYGHDIEITPRDSKADLIEKIISVTSPEIDE